MKKESITICVDNQKEADEAREAFKQNGYDDKYRLNILIAGDDDPVLSLSQFLMSRMK